MIHQAVCFKTDLIDKAIIKIRLLCGQKKGTGHP